MSNNDWDKTATGDIQVFPLVGYRTASFMDGMAGGLRLEFATEPSLKDNASVQIVLSTTQVRGLISALTRLVESLEAQTQASKSEGPAN